MKKSFTLIEVIIVATIVSGVIVLVVQLYNKMQFTKVDIQAKQSLIKGTYTMIEKLQANMKNYTIDYEEYYNRQSVGCMSGTTDRLSSFTRATNGSGYCDAFTKYGNATISNSFTIGGTPVNGDMSIPFYCTSIPQGNPGGYAPTRTGCNLTSTGLGEIKSNTDNSSIQFTNSNQHTLGFGQYKIGFTDYGLDADGDNDYVGDDDDRKFGTDIPAIRNNTGVQELYLISKDKTKRTFIRRELAATGNFLTGADINNLYTLKILKLKGHDIGYDHVVSSGSAVGEGDKQVDTWTCDNGEGFIGNGTPTGLNGANLPSDENDCWTNLFDNNITVSKWNLTINPEADPLLAYDDDAMQTNPYIILNVSTKLYGGPWAVRLNPARLNSFKLDVQTLFNTKTY